MHLRIGLGTVAAMAATVLFLATAAASDAVAWPRSPEARTLAAELRVLAGDARRLREDDVPPLRRDGLLDRIRGGLSSLPLTLRRAGHASDSAPVGALRDAAKRGDIVALQTLLAPLAARFPLHTTGLLPADRRPRAAALARALHDSLCAGCHDDAPLDADRRLPAEDLFASARAMSAEEFTARLLLGVRGDALTSLAQPLSDSDLSALLGLYLDPGAAEKATADPAPR